jgi:DeoR family transcriptional regulator, aga operon transcriptional repressor
MEPVAELTTTERRSQTLALLEDKGQVNVEDLSQLYGVSQVTIRNDLAYLEGKRLIYRTRGGALKMPKVAVDMALAEKARKNADQKRRIALKAVEIIQNGDTIILDSGTTTMEIARNLQDFHNLTVITHALNIASELAGHHGIEVIMPGGIVRGTSFSLVGSQAEQNLRDYYCDRLFLGVDGFETTVGVSTPCVSEAQLNRVMAEIAQQTIVVADSTKFGRKSFAFIIPVSRIHAVITDDGINEADRQNLKSQNVELFIV